MTFTKDATEMSADFLVLDMTCLVNAGQHILSKKFVAFVLVSLQRDDEITAHSIVWQVCLVLAIPQENSDI